MNSTKGVPLVDESLSTSWWEKRNQRYQELEEIRRREWFAGYDHYLDTKEWATRRMLVMQRAQGICEGCRVRTATEVHHLTYDRVGREMLFDLVAICRECHRQITDAAP